MEKINNAKGKLEKNYNVLIITDAQFGKMDVQSNGFNHYEAAMQVATSMTKKQSIRYRMKKRNQRGISS